MPLAATIDIQEALLALQAPGSFAARRTLPIDDLLLEVEGCGPVSFPISAAMAKRLVDVAEQSPFGWRDRTITDLDVRDGWQIAESKLGIDGRRWNPVLRAQLEELRVQLGLPDTARLRARLDKLTIYGPGQFFKLHQDTERSDRMIGTLLVVLPSHYTGGTLRIERNGERVDVRRGARKPPMLELVAFYSDCHHEVRPVQQGYRIALVYDLELEPKRMRRSKLLADPALAAGLEPLARAVHAYFATPHPVPHAFDDRARRPETLVYLLDHQYTLRNLTWSQLKHGDWRRGLALREVAERLDLEAFLCLADVHEVWQCDPGGWARWEVEGDDDEDDDDEGTGGADDHDPVELLGSAVELRHWKDASGEAVDLETLEMNDDELCFTTASHALQPFESKYVGFMGNYGDTLDRWYHRAAVVLWPRSRAFRTLVQTDPEGAAQQLLDASRGDAVDDEAREKLEHLLELWPRHGSRLRDEALSPVVLRLARAVDDAATAAALLDPVAPQEVSTASIGPLLALVQRYGVAWMRKVLVSWHGSPDSSDHHDGTEWMVYPPEWLARLVREAPQAGRALARFIVERQWAELRTWLAEATPFRERSRYERSHPGGFADSARAVLWACTIVDARKLFGAAIARLIADDSALSPLDLATVADGLAAALDDDTARRWDFTSVLRRSRELLVAEIAELKRATGDWSIVVPQTCTCRECTTLHEYLRSPEIALEWPLAKERRRHIHEALGGLDLPVTLVTRPKGRPQTLVLTKTKELFRRDAELRKRYEESLAKVEGYLAGGRPGGAKTVKKAKKGSKARRKQR